MKLRQRLRNLIIDKTGPGIKTRYPIPFKVGIDVEYINVDEDERLSLVNKGYEGTVATYSKSYRWSKYPKSLLEDFLEDEEPGFPDWQEKGRVRLRLIPENIASPSTTQHNFEDAFIKSIFYSTNAVLSFLAPFWIFSWTTSHRDLRDMIYENASGTIENLMSNSSSKIVKLYVGNSPEYKIGIEKLYNHPSMILSGVSILQSIMARAFYDKELRGNSQIFIGNTEYHVLWNNIVSTDVLIEAMNHNYNISFSGVYQIPGLSGEYENMKQVLIDILREYTRNTGSFKDRCSKLVLSFWRDGNTSHGPINNEVALYKVLEDDFSWSRGPEVR